MAIVIADRVKETTSVTGTGTATLLGAATGFQSFAAVGNGNTTYYCIAGQSPSTEWEVGIGTYTSSGTTLSRTTVISSSNSNALVNFSSGTKDVFVTLPASQIPAGASTLAAPQTLTSTSPKFLTFTSTANGASIFLPSATTLNTGSGPIYTFYNSSQYVLRIEDAGGSIVGFLQPNTSCTLTLVDNTTTAGVWSSVGLVSYALLNTLNSIYLYQANNCCVVSLTSSKYLFTWYSGYTAGIYGVVYDASSGVWGTVTQLVASHNRFWAIATGTDSVLLVSGINNNLNMTGRVITTSGTTITVNAATTLTTSYVVDTIFDIQACGSSYIVLFNLQQYSTNLVAATISGTTVTFGSITSTGSNSFLSSSYPWQAPILYIISSSVIAVSWPLTTISWGFYTYTVSGTTITAVTSTSVTTLSNSSHYYYVRTARNLTTPNKFALAYLNASGYINFLATTVNTSTGALSGTVSYTTLTYSTNMNQMNYYDDFIYDGEALLYTTSYNALLWLLGVGASAINSLSAYNPYYSPAGKLIVKAGGSKVAICPYNTTGPIMVFSYTVASGGGSGTLARYITAGTQTNTPANYIYTSNIGNYFSATYYNFCNPNTAQQTLVSTTNGTITVLGHTHLFKISNEGTVLKADLTANLYPYYNSSVTTMFFNYPYPGLKYSARVGTKLFHNPYISNTSESYAVNFIQVWEHVA